MSFTQVYEFRSYVGQNFYQGDLAPSTRSLSFGEGKLAWGLSAGLKLNDAFSINTKFVLGQLVGDDADSPVSGRRERNLSFASPLYEIGFNTEFYFNSVFPSLNKYGIKFYYTTGLNVFQFNPTAFLLDNFGEFQTIELQPLGTEGQGLPGFDEPYSLTQINIPFGVGLKFHLFGRFELGIEIAPRWTFTDYIDDVSTEYLPYEVFIENGKPLAAQLSNRSGDFFGTGPVLGSESGIRRGNSENNDWYLFASIYVAYNIGPSYEPLPLGPVKSIDETILTTPDESIDQDN